MKQLKKKANLIGILLCIALLLAGTFLMAKAFRDSRSLYFTEYDDQISNVLEMVDHSINETLNRCRAEFDYVMSHENLALAEKKYLLSGDPDVIRFILQQSLSLNQNLIDRILVLNQGNYLFSSNTSDTRRYEFIRGRNDSSFCMCRDDEDVGYIAFIETAEGGQFEYVSLIRLEPFYSAVIASHVYDTYWTVLYDADCNLFMHNEETTPCFKLLTEEEALARKDGFSFLVQSENEKRDSIISYTYVNLSGDLTNGRIMTRCSADTDNGIFAIGIAISNGVLFDRWQTNLEFMIIATTLLFFSIVFSFFLFMRGRRNRLQIEQRMQLLEEKSKLDEQRIAQQRELAHHQRMETIGTLTTGVAHEFNNLLTPIMGYSMMILEKESDTSEEYDNALEIYQASVKAKNLVSRISRLSGKNIDESSQKVPFAAVIRGAMELASHSIPGNVTVVTDAEPSAIIYGNEAQLEQMLLNLIINSVQAIDGNDGCISISVVTKGDQVICTVSDTGPGIPKEIQDKIFDPFFSTKEIGKGTGLGLSIVAQTVLDHKGTIHLESEPGHASFILSFPKRTE